MWEFCVVGNANISPRFFVDPTTSTRWFTRLPIYFAGSQIWWCSVHKLFACSLSIPGKWIYKTYILSVIFQIEFIETDFRCFCQTAK